MPSAQGAQLTTHTHTRLPLFLPGDQAMLSESDPQTERDEQPAAVVTVNERPVYLQIATHSPTRIITNFRNPVVATGHAEGGRYPHSVRPSLKHPCYSSSSRTHYRAVHTPPLLHWFRILESFLAFEDDPPSRIDPKLAPLQRLP